MLSIDYMTDDDRKTIQSLVNHEGFDYTFIDYSDFAEIDDPKLHELIEDYRTSRQVLAQYAGVEA